MGFWSHLSRVFKPKQRTQCQNNQNNVLPNERTFQQQIEHNYQQTIENEKKSTNPKFHRTSNEENLAFNFTWRHSEALEPLESSVNDETKKVFNIWHIDERIDQCKKAIASYEKLRKFCLSKGKGGTIHFEDMWEHCHNRKNEDFRYIERVENEIELLSTNYQKASEKLHNEKLAYEKKQRIKAFKVNADTLLIKLVSENNGILQKGLYKQFESEYKTAINSVLKKLHDTDKIIRIKEGNTYKLFAVTNR